MIRDLSVWVGCSALGWILLIGGIWLMYLILSAAISGPCVDDVTGGPC